MSQDYKAQHINISTVFLSNNWLSLSNIFSFRHTFRSIRLAPTNLKPLNSAHQLLLSHHSRLLTSLFKILSNVKDQILKVRD